jgi:hypothetical protein
MAGIEKMDILLFAYFSPIIITIICIICIINYPKLKKESAFYTYGDVVSVILSSLIPVLNFYIMFMLLYNIGKIIFGDFLNKPL